MDVRFDPIGAAQTAVGKASDFAGGVGNAVSDPGKTWSDTGGGLVNNMTNTAGQAWTSFTTTAAQAWTNFTTTAGQAWTNVTTTAGQATNNIATGATQVVHTAARTVTQAAHNVADTTTQMVTYASANAGTITHLALGAATFIPIVGTAAAVADAGLYAYEGDYLAASLSMLAVVPGGQILGDAAKLARGGEKAVNVVNDVEKIEKVATDLEKVGQTASGAEKAGRSLDGVVYLRRDTTGALEDYVGQAKNAERFEARQAEHAAEHPGSTFEFTELDHAKPGLDLDVAEENWIRAGGGPGGHGRPGDLSNARFQMSDARYKAAGGNVSIPPGF
jgi:hypothetical protein